ncbi:class I SAM-dependent methyltransferase [Yunchengibacter salinarum]|uniref:class I SAM-dependent methyltransferase n=1 Tax=Yunchengibacter salinarum TaxID=3133399 RepID=UPI0035B61BB6
MDKVAAFDRVRAGLTLPDVSGLERWPYTLDSGGRHLIEDVIRRDRPALMLEIGCFLGVSARRWLDANPALRLIGLDPWDDGLIDQVRRYVGRPKLAETWPERETQQRFADAIARQGPFESALANLDGVRDRFLPWRGRAPEALQDIDAAGLVPDLVYIDAAKQRADLDTVRALWPAARITGDDWDWNRRKNYPMRRIVEAFAAEHGLAITAEGGTWVLG